MFDISFAELMMVAVVALLVVGPDKLPQVARTVGTFIGRLQRYVSQVKEEMNRDDRFQELQKLQQEIKQGADQVESSITAGANEVKETLAAAEQSVKPKRKTTRKTAATKKPTAKTSTSKTPSTKRSASKKPAAKKAMTKKTKTKEAKGQA